MKASVSKYGNLKLHENSARHKAVMDAIEQKNATQDNPNHPFKTYHQTIPESQLDKEDTPPDEFVEPSSSWLLDEELSISDAE